MSRRVIVSSDRTELAAFAAAMFTEIQSAAVTERGKVTVALAGGSTPRDTYQRLRNIDWSKSQLFFGDERFVAFNDPSSNYGMVQASLLEPESVPDSSVFPVTTGLATADDAVQAYERTLMQEFGLPNLEMPPRFDLILLGLGSDGHTASLFPGAPSLNVDDRWVVASPPGTLPPPVERITMTFPVLNAAREVVFLVSGRDKASIVREVLQSPAGRDTHPSEGVSPSDGRVTWLLDREAASQLTIGGRPYDGALGEIPIN